MKETKILAPVETYDLFGEVVEVLLTGEMTDNRSSIIIETTPPKMGPPPHVHHSADETVTVLEGQFEILCDKTWKPLGIGEMAFIPQGTVHTFRNAGESPGRIAAAFFPAGFERFFSIFSEGLTKDNMAERLKVAGESVDATFFV